MDAEPWHVPCTDEGRHQLYRLVEEYRQSGQLYELGCSLSRLAAVVKQLGSPGVDAVPESARLGAEAVQVLRQVEDKRELAMALVRAAVPFCKVNQEALLNEALSLAREINDKEVEGWVLYRMTRADGVKGHSLNEALGCFEEAGCKKGMATCLAAMGFGPEGQDADLLRRAVALYEEEGMTREANRTRGLLNLIVTMEAGDAAE